MSTQQAPLALEAQGICKKFGTLVANDEVNLKVKKGQIHALLGENGAGKSTLVNILFGLYKADQGEVSISGEKVEMNSPHDAINKKIGMVQKHFQLVPVLSVTENIVLGDEPTSKGGALDFEKAAAEVSELGKRYGLEVDPRAIVEDLPIGYQQRVEILRSLYLSLIHISEPTRPY